MKNNMKYQYLMLGDSIICRYPLAQDKEAYHVIGEVYNNKDNAWIRKSSTMGYKMSGEGTVVSERKALATIKKYQLKNAN